MLPLGHPEQRGAMVAEMERELIKERTIAGLAAARAKGGNGGGRKSVMTPDMLDTARKLLAAGDTPVKLAKLLQVGRSTFYRHFPASERTASGIKTDLFRLSSVNDPTWPHNHLGQQNRSTPPLQCHYVAMQQTRSCHPSDLNARR